MSAIETEQRNVMFLRDHGKDAIISRNASITYAEAMASVCDYAARYELKPGERAAVFSENRAEWIYAYFSIWHNGGINVPIDHMSSADEVAYILNDCKPAAVFCSAATRPVLSEAMSLLGPGTKPRVIDLDGMGTAPRVKPRPGAAHGAQDTAVIIYTSGTTGSPKGVMLSYDNLLANIEAVSDIVPIYTRDQRLLAILPFHHSFPLLGTVLAPLYVGATVVLLERISSADILQALVEHKVTMVLGVPRLYKLFHKGLIDKVNASIMARALLWTSRRLNSLSFGRVAFRKVQQAFGGHIRYLISGGAKLDETVGRDLAAMGFEMLEGYGMTEAAPMITFTRPGRVSIGTAGEAMPGVTIRIIDGQITASGRNIMKGYWNNPEDTAAVVRDGWLQTGDQGFLDNRGRLHITGRFKEIIVLSNGKNINPEEIERRILQLSPLIKEVGVYHHREKLGAVIHPDALAVAAQRIGDLRQAIKTQVLDKFNKSAPIHKQIRHFTISEQELPKTRLGKIKRFKLTEVGLGA